MYTDENTAVSASSAPASVNVSHNQITLSDLALPKHAHLSSDNRKTTDHILGITSHDTHLQLVFIYLRCL